VILLIGRPWRPHALCPNYVPFGGADAGFDPQDHTKVDPRLGWWDDIAALARDGYKVMADLIVNHISCSSPQFADWLAKGPHSAYDGMFLTFGSIFPRGFDGIFATSAPGAHLQAAWTNGDQVARLIAASTAARAAAVDHPYRRPPSRCPDRSRAPPSHCHLTCTCRLLVRPRHPGALTLRRDARPGAESRQRLMAVSILASCNTDMPASVPR
jgi:hypothetical protein